MSRCTWQTHLGVALHQQSVLGILGVSKASTFWLGGNLVPNMVGSESVMVSTPLNPLLHGVLLFTTMMVQWVLGLFPVNSSYILVWSGFSQFLLLTSVTTTGISTINSFPLILRWRWGLWWEDLAAHGPVMLLLPHSTCQELSLMSIYSALVVKIIYLPIPGALQY